MLRRARSLVGVDIGATAIKAVELTSGGGSRKLLALGREPLPPGAVVDGGIADAAAVSAAMRRLFERLHVDNTQVAAALSCGAAIVKRITLPSMSELELAASIAWEIEQHLPLDVDEVDFDYQALAMDRSATPETMDVVVVAARKEQVARLAAVVADAGRTPVVIDVVPLAIQNAYEANYGSEPHVLVALIDAGASTTTVHVIRGERMLFTGQVPSENVVDGIRASFGSIPSSSGAVERILVTGGGSRSASFIDTLTEGFRVPVERLDPFRRVTFAPESSEVDLAEAAATSAVAVGLALRRVDDR